MAKNFAPLSLALLAMAVFAGSFASAGQTGFAVLTESRDQFDAQFTDGKLNQEVVDQINVQMRDAPAPALILFGKNKANVYMTYDDGTVRSYWIWTQNNLVNEISLGARSDADTEVRVNESTVDRIVNSANPFNELVNALSSGEIQYNGLTASGQMSGIIVSIAAKIIGVILGLLHFFTGGY